jgi:hypothetical protein
MVHIIITYSPISIIKVSLKSEPAINNIKIMQIYTFTIESVLFHFYKYDLIL